jgi:Arc/MetJ-type ribon-helix-helix transcriptional regulator
MDGMEHPDDIQPEDNYLAVADYDIDETLTQSEKLTINMPMMTIAQIDALIESGHFQNRAEFFRFSAMQQLEKYGNERFPWKQNLESKKLFVVGILSLGNKTLLKAKRENKLINIRVVGILLLSPNIDKDLFMEVCNTVRVYGSIKGPKEIKKIIETLKFQSRNLLL